MKHNEILDYLRAIDAEMAKYAREGETLSLYLIGRSALILRYGLDLGTKDVDIVHLHGNELESKAVEIFGKGSPNANRRGFLPRAGASGIAPDSGAYAPSPRTFRVTGK